MKRYIEIVYDNSGSMTGLLNDIPKYKIAQQLFKTEILPVIGRRGDQVVLRTLGSGCHLGTSVAELLPSNRDEMLNRIQSIVHDHSTPLFHTIADAVKGCQSIQADEHLIFVLTDGDDTCQINIEDVLDPETIKKHVRFYKVLMVQLAIDSPISRNNLTSAINYLGGQTILLDRYDKIEKMGQHLGKALKQSGFAEEFPLAPCFDFIEGEAQSWSDLKKSGLNLYKALLLYNKGLLSWQPNRKSPVSQLQAAELQFLSALFFETCLPEDLIRSMLSQLSAPYYYSFDCIYWDFANSRWRYFKKENPVFPMENDEALLADEDTEEDEHRDWERKETYQEETVYRVLPEENLFDTRYLLNPERPAPESLDKMLDENVITLRPGDRVKFIN